MEWYLMLLLVMGSLLVLMALGIPVAFCFMIVNLIAVSLFWGHGGLGTFILSLRASVTTFTLMPIPLFIVMGEVLFYSGVAPNIIDAIDKWLGRLPGRLSLLSVAGGTLFATLTGVSMGSTALLGSVLVPEMEKRGYKKSMSLGPIMGSGGLAIMIPPSSLAVLLGGIGLISIGKILIAIIIPGLLTAALFVAYIVIRCWLQPSLAPAYETPHIPLIEKITVTVRHIIPIGIVIFLVIGVIMLGIATPTEAAATGVIGTLILAALHRKLSWEVVKKSMFSTLSVTVMIFMIIVGAKAFSQNLAYTGASRGLVEFVGGLSISPIFIIVAMQVVLLMLGAFMDPVGIMMVTLPLFMPIVETLGFSTVWFATVFLLNMEMATISPPFGLNLFVMKGVAPSDTTMGDIYRAALPFLGCEIAALALTVAFPIIALWMPGLMQ